MVGLGLLDISIILCSECYFNERISGTQLEQSKYSLWTGYQINHIEKQKISISMLQITPGQNETLGISILKSRGIFTDAKWYWIGFSALIGYTLLFNILFTVALSFLSRKCIYYFRNFVYLETQWFIDQKL
jgi:hypothetical protein